MAIQINKTAPAQPDAPAAPQESSPVQSIADPAPTPPEVEEEAPKPVKKAVSGGELKAILAQIRKEKGENVVNKGSEIHTVLRIPTGVFEFDLATGGGFPRGRYSIVYGPESSGKCHARGDKVLMYSGQTREVEYIQKGDVLMGPDSKPRTVQAIGGGFGALYRIDPIKGQGAFTVNGEHQLHLVCTHNQGDRRKGDKVQISVQDYLLQSKDWKIYHHLYRVGVEFPEKEVSVDPYFLGLWLGDGSSSNMQVYSVSTEIVDWLQDYADRMGGRLSKYDQYSACPGYAIVGSSLRESITDMGLFRGKHIPVSYLRNSRRVRLQLLAGLIDTDGAKGSGSSCVFYNNNRNLCNQVQELAQSLGYYAATHGKKTSCNGKPFQSWAVYISMDDPEELPLLLNYKRPEKRTKGGSCLTSRFSVTPIGEGEFFGFEVDADHLYLTDGYIVNHNTNICYAAAAQAQRLPEPCNKVVWVDLEGCVAEDSRFIDMVSGQVYTAREVYEQRLPLVVRSYDNDQGKIIFKPLADWIDNGVKEVFSVETATSELRVTGNHKLWVRESLDAPAKWVRTDELQVGWYVSRPHKDKDWQWPEKGEHTGDEAHFLGLMLGDGSFNPSGSPTFCNIDPATIDRLRGLLTHWGMKLTTYSDRHHRLTGEVKASKWAPTQAAKLIRAWGLHGCTGPSKHVPEQFFSETRSVTLELLAGLYMTDGTVNKVRPTLALSNTSLTLLEQVRELWRRLGVYSTLHKTKMYADHHTQQYILSINGLEQLQSVAGILPLYGDKLTRLLQWADTPVSESCQSRTGKVGVSKFKGGLVWDRLTSVEPFGEQQTYDFTVFETHNYVVNDLVAHNTFDANWAAQFGINVDELLIVRPSYGEEAVDLIDALVRAEDVAMLVVDSLATVVSSKEIEQSVEKFDVGTASLLVKRLCNKLVIALATESKRNHTPAVVLINQTRFKIGVMFGDPETMPGGQTMKFLSSLTVRLYGKNKIEKSISSELPAFKDTTAVIKKAKVGVTKYNFEYELCMLPHNGMIVGETKSWSTVSGYLKDMGALKKADKGSGWTLLGKTFPTLVMIQDQYESDDDYKMKLQGLVIDSFKGKHFTVEATGAAKG